jgi:hypothetical protein
VSLEKAMIIIKKGSKEERVYVMFNPNEYTLETANQYAWKTIPGLQQPIAQFVSGEAPTLSMELFFDSYELQEDVRNYTGKITGIMDVNNDLHAPPLCKFVWGSLSFEGVLERVSQKFTMFLDTGIPVRATLNVTFKSVRSIQDQFKDIPRQSADRTKQRTIRQGDQLWQIAAEEYEDPRLWRAIANANGIHDPRRLEPGTVIKIPRLYG